VTYSVLGAEPVALPVLRGRWERTGQSVAIAAAMFTRHVELDRRLLVGRLLDDADPRVAADWRDPEHVLWGGERLAEARVAVLRGLGACAAPVRLPEAHVERVYAGVTTDREQVEGPRWRVEISPGSVKVTRRDPVKWDVTRERARESGRKRARLELAMRTAETCHDGCLREACGCRNWDAREVRAIFAGLDASDVFAAGAAKIGAWSVKSRSAMRYRLSTLDYAPLFVDAHGNQTVPAMVTLTYPGDWEAVVPDNATARRHVRTLVKRWDREWGEWELDGVRRSNPLVGVWKREFQRRGAPHYHVLCAIPESKFFRQWLSETWAEIVDAEHCGQVPEDRSGLTKCCEFHRHVAAGTGVDFREGARAADPRRLAVYFAKHGAYGVKEYQNEAPESWLSNGGAGRFWGVWGLAAVVSSVEVDPVTALAVARTLRRLEHSKRYALSLRTLRCKCHTRVDEVTGELPTKHRQACFRWNTVVVARFRGSLGHVVVNDGPALASALARAAERARPGHAVRRSGGPPLGFLP
jgi:hypothetical protein